MSRRPPTFGRQPDQLEDDIQYQKGPFQSPARQRARSPYYRDPDTGRFLTDQEAAYVERLARQYPQQVHRAYAQNVSFAAVGLPVPPNLGDQGTQVGPQGQPQQFQQFSQQPPGTGYQQQPAPVNQQPMQGGQYRQSEQIAPEPQGSRVAGSQEPGGQPQENQQPPQQQIAEQPGGQIGGETEQSMQTQPGDGQPVQQAPPDQPQQVSNQRPDPTAEQPQGSHSAGGVRIPVERGGSGQASQIPLREASRRSQRHGNRQRSRQRRWFWWYNW